jgi:hypothetical protein
MKQWLCRVGNVGRDGLLGSRYINTTCVFCFLLLTQCGLYGVRVFNERYILRSADMIDDCSITDPFILLESIPLLYPFQLPPSTSLSSLQPGPTSSHQHHVLDHRCHRHYLYRYLLVASSSFSSLSTPSPNQYMYAIWQSTYYVDPHRHT